MARPSSYRGGFPTPTRHTPVLMASSFAASDTSRKNTFTPTEKFGLHTRPVPAASPLRTHAVDCSSQPVVPTTTFTPSAAAVPHSRPPPMGWKTRLRHRSRESSPRVIPSQSRIVELIQLERDFATVLRGELLDELAHLPVTDDAPILHAISRTPPGRVRERTRRAGAPPPLQISCATTSSGSTAMLPARSCER